MVLKIDMNNIQGELKNLKAKVSNLNREGHIDSFSPATKDRGIPELMWKREGQALHPTWWSTTYCWSHGVGGHAGADLKNKRPGHKSKATSMTRLVGITFDLTQVLLQLGTPTSNLNATHNELILETLANFFQTKNACSGHPPTNIE